MSICEGRNEISWFQFWCLKVRIASASEGSKWEAGNSKVSNCWTSNVDRISTPLERSSNTLGGKDNNSTGIGINWKGSVYEGISGGREA